MMDLPNKNVQIVHEQVIVKQEKVTNGAIYQMSETDLSFCDELAGLCSGEASSGPVDRIISKTQNKSV